MNTQEGGVLDGGGGSRNTNSSQPVSLDRLCPVGTAARVLQLSRLVQVRHNAR